MKKENELLKRIAKAKMQRVNSISKTHSSKNSINTPSNKRIISSKKIIRPLKVCPVKNHNSIFLTGGIGDIFAVESFLTDAERNRISCIYYATNKRKYIEQLFRCVSDKDHYPVLKNHCILWDDFSNFWCFYSMEDYLKKTKSKKNMFNYCKDLSILRVFNDVKAKTVKYNSSTFLNKKLTDISHLNLPQEYVTILPYSTDKRCLNRDFNDSDWSNIVKILKKNNKKGVVINQGEDKVFKNDFLINLSNMLTILEAVEVLKNSIGYLGIDSWLSVLAAKLFDNSNLQIKSTNNHCYENAYCYYAPKTDFDFIVNNIKYR